MFEVVDMEIQDFLSEQGIVPMAELTTLATNRAAFGDDVVAPSPGRLNCAARRHRHVLTAAETGAT